MNQHRALIRLALTAILIASPAPLLTQDEILLLDEQWDVELQMRDVQAAPVQADRDGDPRVKSGRQSLRLQNTTGAPQVRIRNAGSISLAQASVGSTIKLWYRTDAWPGRWQVRLFTYHQPVHNRTFALLEGDLDGGGNNGRLLADNQWHEATATLVGTEFTPRVDVGARVPLFVMLVAQSASDIEHTTYIDRIALIPRPHDAEAPGFAVKEPDPFYLPPPGAVEWTGPELRPMPSYAGPAKRLNPADDVQAALDVAQPGDVLALAPGVYRQPLTINASGTPAQPIVLCAEQPGTVTLSGAAPGTFRVAFEPVAGDLYQASVPWRVRWVMADGRNLIAYDSLELLKTFSMPGRGGEAESDQPPEGFTWDGGTLYVRLFEGEDPRAVPVEINRQYDAAEADLPNSEYWSGLERDWRTEYDETLDERQGGTLVTVNAEHVILGGLKLHLAPEVGVRVKGDHVTIHDCLFTGTLRGIQSGASADLTVEHCEYSLYPRYQWLRWSERAHGTWANAWGDFMRGLFLHHHGPRVRVRNCLVYEAYDAMRPRNMNSTDPGDMAEYAYNFIHSNGDECIEFDTHQPINLRVHHNVFMDAVVMLALSPVLGGNLMIDHNLVYVSPDNGLRKCVMLKFYMIPGWKGRGPTRRCTIAHNTMVNTHNYLYWTGEDHIYEDNTIENNLIWLRLSRQWQLPNFPVSPHNLYSGPNVQREHLPGTVLSDRAGFINAEPPVVELKQYVHPPLNIRGMSDPPVSADASPIWPRMDFHLTPDSPAVDVGAPSTEDRYGHRSKGAAPDLGAVELGDEWRFPRPGPRWARGDLEPWRPTMPASIDPAWVGLQQ